MVESPKRELDSLRVIGNERLQQMMGIMAGERGGQVFATDERFVLFSLRERLLQDLTNLPDFA